MFTSEDSGSGSSENSELHNHVEFDRRSTVTNEGPCTLASVVSYTNYGRNLILGVRLFIKKRMSGQC